MTSYTDYQIRKREEKQKVKQSLNCRW